MKRKIKIYLFIFFISNLGWAKLKIAILRIDTSKNTPPYLETNFQKLLNQACAEKGYQIVNKNRVSSLKKRDCNEKECLVNIGIKLEVRVVGVGKIETIGENYIASLILVDVLKKDFILDKSLECNICTLDEGVEMIQRLVGSIPHSDLIDKSKKAALSLKPSFVETQRQERTKSSFVGPKIKIKIKKKKEKSDYGFWPWAGAGVGLVGLGIGIPLMLIHGEFACNGEVYCREVYDTNVPGTILTVLGGLSAGMAITLFVLENR